MRTCTFVAFDDPKTYTQEEVDALVAEKKGFSQEDVNTFLAKEKRKTQDTQKQLAGQLEEARKNASLSDDERTDLTKQIDELQTKYMSGEERARQIRERADKQHTEVLQSAEKDRDSWKTRYTRSRIDGEITRAAVENKAVNPGQIIAMLQPTTRLAEVLGDDGKPSGAYEERVMFNDLDKEEKPVVLDLTVSQAVKRMTELETFGNLFVGSKSGGLGGSGSSKKGGAIDIAKIAREDPARYRRLRKEQPELFRKM